jgi:hypothetical protein
VLHERVISPLFDAVWLHIAESNPVHQGMGFEKIHKAPSKLAKPYHADADTHNTVS